MNPSLPPGLKKLLPIWDQKEWGKRKAREEGIVRETKKKIRKEREGKKDEIL